MRVRVEYSKNNLMRFISHRDSMRQIFRILRRSGLPAAFSEGFSAHLRVSFNEPLKVGVESLQEWFDMILTERINPEQIQKSLAQSVPEGYSIKGVSEILQDAPSITESIQIIEYVLLIPAVLQDHAREFYSVCSGDELLMSKIDKKGREKEIDLAKWRSYCYLEEVDEQSMLRLGIQRYNGSFCSPAYFQNVCNRFCGSKEYWRITRTKTVLLY